VRGLNVSILVARGWLSQDNYGSFGAVNLWKEQQMKHLKFFLVVLIALSMTSWAAFAAGASQATAAQGQSTALERGYRTGYSDGYNSGYGDVADHAPRNYQNKDEYQRADRSYNEAWGTVEDYRDGYQQGFEAGYAAGYDRRPFDSSIPAGISRRGAVNSGPISNQNDTQNNSGVSDDTQNSSGVNDDTQNNSGVSSTTNQGPLEIRRDAILVVELQSPLSTDISQQGDRFQARVLEPRELEGATVEGRVTRVKRAGKVKGTSELQLSFDTIRTTDGRTSSFNADVVEVVDMGNRNVGTVDSEGGVRGRDSTKDDVSKVGASTGIGAIVGAIFGGGKGAAIGAAIGAGVGTGGVLSSRGKDVRLDRGQQLKIRSATEIRIQ
jgi:hypothetical protein